MDSYKEIIGSEMQGYDYAKLTTEEDIIGIYGYMAVEKSICSCGFIVKEATWEWTIGKEDIFSQDQSKVTAKEKISKGSLLFYLKFSESQTIKKNKEFKHTLFLMTSIQSISSFSY